QRARELRGRQAPVDRVAAAGLLRLDEGADPLRRARERGAASARTEPPRGAGFHRPGGGLGAALPGDPKGADAPVPAPCRAGEPAHRDATPAEAPVVAS